MRKKLKDLVLTGTLICLTGLVGCSGRNNYSPSVTVSNALNRRGLEYSDHDSEQESFKIEKELEQRLGKDYKKLDRDEKKDLIIVCGLIPENKREEVYRFCLDDEEFMKFYNDNAKEKLSEIYGEEMVRKLDEGDFHDRFLIWFTLNPDKVKEYVFPF